MLKSHCVLLWQEPMSRRAAELALTCMAVHRVVIECNCSKSRCAKTRQEHFDTSGRLLQRPAGL